MPRRQIDKQRQSMTAGNLIKEFTPEEADALFRGFLCAVESGQIDLDGSIPRSAVDLMPTVHATIGKYWNGA